MRIEVLVEGDSDTRPITKIFDYERSTFAVTSQLIKEHLSENRPLNMDETLRLFVAYIIDSIEKNKQINEIQANIPKLVLPHQVMIGVPEILRILTFKIIDHADTKVIHITTPIPINQYFLNEQAVGSSVD